MIRFKHIGVVAVAGMALGACGKGKVSQTVQPDASTASEALGEGQASFDCTEVAPAAQPLVVDWPDTDRMDLALALQQEGVAVVHYACDGMKLLKHCSLAGDYQFAGAPMMLQVVELESADSVAATLPVQGMKFAAEVSGDSKIDVATAIIGRSNTLLRAPTTTELEGECDGATHYVRSAYMGAFSVATGTKGQVAAAAEVFGASAAASSTSSRNSLNRDGDLEACEGYDPDQPKPPGQCRSAVRVELSPLAAADAGPPSQNEEEEELPQVCPDGYAFAAGKCARKDSGAAYRCDRGNEQECLDQCKAGNAESCYLATVSGMPLAPNDPKYKAKRAREMPMLEQACDGGVPIACHTIAMNYGSKNAGMYDPAKALKAYGDACFRQLFPNSCLALSKRHENGDLTKKNPKTALALRERACRLGSTTGCTDLGKAYLEGNKKLVAKRDQAKGLEVLDRACSQAKMGYACFDLAEYYGEGKFLRMDRAKADSYKQVGCRLVPASHECEGSKKPGEPPRPPRPPKAR